MSVQTVSPQTIDFFPGSPIHFQEGDGRFSGDGGLLLFRQLDDDLGFTQAFASVLNDPRDPQLIEHSTIEMVRLRVFGILADYEDQNDTDTLLTDPVFELLINRVCDGRDLPSQPTLSRFENSIDIASLENLAELFIDEFRHYSLIPTRFASVHPARSQALPGNGLPRRLRLLFD